ncbi:MAG TPA: hypothetical protein VF152_02070, partial [Acidimicrobiia bacterium]
MGSLLVLSTVWLLPHDVDLRPYVVLSLVGLGAGIATAILPWSRWPTWTLVIPPCVAYALLAVGGLFAEHVLEYYLAFYTLT